MPPLDELERLILGGREGLSIEFKAGMGWSQPATKGKVVKASLAMANNRDGGVLAFGIELPSGQTTHQVVGMTEDDWGSFSQDAVAAKVNAHATPHIDLSVEHRIIDGKRLVAIVVRQFVDFPIICSTDLSDAGRLVVTRGKMYCRSRRMAESTEIQSPDDLRDIIELATAKALERYFRLRTVEHGASGPNALAQFDAQIRDLGL